METNIALFKQQKIKNVQKKSSVVFKRFLGNHYTKNSSKNIIKKTRLKHEKFAMQLEMRDVRFSLLTRLANENNYSLREIS